MIPITLTRDSISEIHSGRAAAADFKPIIQIMNILKIQPTAANPSDRFRVILSDGTHFTQGMLTSTLNNLVTNNQMNQRSIIQLDKYIQNNISGKKIIIVLGLKIINGQYPNEIGTPVSIEEAGGVQPQQQQQQQPQHQQFQRQSQFRQQQQPQSSAPMGGNYNSNPYKQNQAQQRSGGSGSAANYMSGTGLNALGGAPIVPVNALSPYRNKWTIKVRCTSKSDVRHWNKATNSGKLFSVDLVDENKVEIRCTVFNEGVDKFQDVFKVDGVFLISKGKVKQANKRFTRIPNDYEINLDGNSQVEMVSDDVKIQGLQFDFVKINNLQQKNNGDFADIIGIVKRIDPLSSVTSTRLNKTIPKRTILLADETGTVELTLWSETAEKYHEEVLKGFPVIVLKAAKVTEFGGRSLSNTQSFLLNPDRPEVYKLKTWWNQEGSNLDLPSMSTGGGAAQGINDNDQFYTLSEIKDRQLGRSQDNKPDFFVTKATITSIRHEIEKPPYYVACQETRDGRLCNKKVDTQNGQIWCEGCAKNVSSYGPRYILSFALNDHTGSYYMNAFNDTGEQILKVTAQQLMETVEQSNENAFNGAFADALFQTKLFKIRAKVESYNDEERVKCTVVAVDDLNYIKESAKLLDYINQLQQSS